MQRMKFSRQDCIILLNDEKCKPKYQQKAVQLSPALENPRPRERDSMPGLFRKFEFYSLSTSSVKASNKHTFNIERPGPKTRTVTGFAKQVRVFERPKRNYG